MMNNPADAGFEIFRSGCRAALRTEIFATELLCTICASQNDAAAEEARARRDAQRRTERAVDWQRFH
jgi:hypothetical protein